MYIPFVAALIPLIIGMIWYNPKVFGNAWMNSSGMTMEKAKGANMPLMMILSYVFSLLVAFSLMSLTIHQLSVFSIFNGDPTASDPNSEVGMILKTIQEKYWGNFRTFKHGALHGTIGGLFIALPIIATSALYERRGFKYIMISAGYWIVSMAIMGGVICAFM